MRDTVKGVFWITILRIITRIIAYGKLIVFARILSPLEFGLFGVSALALAFLETITETGINVVLVQDNKNIKQSLSSAWLISILRGVVITTILLLFSPSIATFFNSPASYGLIQAISIVPFLRGFINPAVVIFQKELQFKKEFWFRLTIFCVDSVVSLVSILITQEVISLVYGLIAGVIVEVMLSYIVIKEYPTISFERKQVSHVFHRGKWVTLTGVFNYLFQNGDKIVVGKLLGTASLGLYQMAYNISIIPITEIADVFSKVSFPLYTKISSDPNLLKQTFKNNFIAISLLSVLFGSFLFIFADLLIHLTLGEKWVGIIPVLRVLSIFGIIRAIESIPFSFFLAFRKQEYITLITLVSIFGFLISILPFVMAFGIVGAALSATFGSIISLPFVWYYTKKILKNI